MVSIEPSGLVVIIIIVVVPSSFLVVVSEIIVTCPCASVTTVSIVIEPFSFVFFVTIVSLIVLPLESVINVLFIVVHSHLFLQMLLHNFR